MERLRGDVAFWHTEAIWADYSFAIETSSATGVVAPDARTGRHAAVRRDTPLAAANRALRQRTLVRLAAKNDEVIAGFDRGELIAIGALLVSIVAALISVLTWRRAPGSTIELRNISVDRDPAGELRFSCIARNRSPHAVELTRGHVRWRSWELSAYVPSSRAPRVAGSVGPWRGP